MAKISAIYICPEKGAPMVSVPKVRAYALRGLEGDRFFLGTGTYSGKPNKGKPNQYVRDVTFISSQAMIDANLKMKSPMLPEETRRNIIVDGDVDLLGLIERNFVFGSVQFRGFEDCTPCKLPGNMVDKNDFIVAYQACGGLRARIVTDGFISVGDQIHYLFV